MESLQIMEGLVILMKIIILLIGIVFCLGYKRWGSKSYRFISKVDEKDFQLYYLIIGIFFVILGVICFILL